MFARIAILAAALALSACAPLRDTPAAPGGALAAGPPLVDGAYTFPDCEGEGGCPNKNWRTASPTPLLASRAQTADVIATLPPGEWLRVEQLETRLVPRRGVVRADALDFRAGEVVYALAYLGEGEISIWRRGAHASVSDYDPVVIDWQQPEPPPAIAATLGTWARIKRGNGQTGWVSLQPGRFECLGSLAGDADCRD